MQTNNPNLLDRPSSFDLGRDKVGVGNLEPLHLDMSCISEDALEAMFDRIHNLALVFSCNLYPEDPAELAQQVCTNIIRTATTQGGLKIDHLPYYVSCVATNARTDFLRKRRRVTLVSDYLIAETASPCNPGFQVEDSLVFYDIFQQALASLTEFQRGAFLLDLEGYTNQEIADFYKIDVSVIKARLYRARQNLQENLAAGVVQAEVVSNYPSYVKEYIKKQL